MSRGTPEQVLKSIVDGINSGNLDALMPLYEAEAAFAAQPGSLNHGLPGIREALAGFIAMKGTLDLKVTGSLRQWSGPRNYGLVIHWNRARRRTGEAGGKIRGCSASSGRRLLALSDRQPLGNGLALAAAPAHSPENRFFVHNELHPPELSPLSKRRLSRTPGLLPVC